MAILKCKMCGGNIEVGENQNIGVCDSCGSTMTIPNVNDERILNLFDRANHFRLQNEFDKALAAYESILSEDNKNAEAHWGCVLSRYGIEYVEDPKTHKRVPTCHRVQSESVLSDLDYKAAIEYSDDISAKNLYKQEAEAIAEIQKNILMVANNEAPYDIFICYKETDNNGKRTIDSTLAQDIYYQLTNEGYKVFFSRITLEDKLGTEYEPYIFSALNSAKIMLVVGTSKDYFNAVWVKNEWARFLDLARKDKSKMIIPCYRDMDAYDLPDELSMFQSQDMGKIGFVQDLIRGINKVLKPQMSFSNTTSLKNDVVQLSKRANIFLENGEYKKAVEYFNKVLDIDPENSKAYWGKFLATVGVNSSEALLSSKYFLDVYSGNIPIPDGTTLESTPESLIEDFYESNYDNISKQNPTLGIFADYQNAVKFSSNDEREYYIDINRKLVEKRRKMLDTIESRRNHKQSMSDSTTTKTYNMFLILGCILLGICMIIIIMTELS